jgi:hypothetical protein
MDTVITSFNVCLLFFAEWLEQGGNFSSGIPLQMPSFPKIDTAVALLNIPSFGTSPSKLLNERFKLASPLMLSKNFGMLPEKLLWERSRTWRPYSFSSNGGIFP